MYRIKYNYDTGNSFHTEQGLEELLEFEWKDLKVAEANMDRIKEHYQQYRQMNTYSHHHRGENILEKNRTKDWFVAEYRTDRDNKKVLNMSAAQYQLILYTDDGKPIQFHAPWCGYFESLNWVEIVTDTHRITF